MAQLDAIGAARALYRPAVDRAHHRVAKAQGHHRRARLHARALLGQHELAAVEILAIDGLGHDGAPAEFVTNFAGTVGNGIVFGRHTRDRLEDPDGRQKMPVVATEYQNVPSAERSRASTRARRGSRSAAVAAPTGRSTVSA